MHTRAIVYPQGLPKREVARGHCDQLVLTCGGDPLRQFERQAGTLADFTRYMVRMPAFRLGQVEGLVVLTHTQPFNLLLPTRRTLERELPILARAAWLLFWDHELHPAFPHHLASQGKLDGLLDQAPIWRSASGERFLVVSTRTTLETMKTRLKELRTETAQASEVRPRRPSSNQGTVKTE